MRINVKSPTTPFQLSSFVCSLHFQQRSNWWSEQDTYHGFENVWLHEVKKTISSSGSCESPRPYGLCPTVLARDRPGSAALPSRAGQRAVSWSGRVKGQEGRFQYLHLFPGRGDMWLECFVAVLLFDQAALFRC